MEDTDKSPVAKRRGIDQELHGNTSLVNRYISDNIVPNIVKEEIDDDDDDNNGNNDENIDNSDDGSFDRYYGNPHDDKAIAFRESLFDHDEMSVDQFSDGNDDEKIDDKRKLLIATEKLACLDGKYFEVVIDESSLTGTVIAKCKLCDSQKRFKGSLRSTSNFTTHLKRCHKNNYEEYTKYSEEKRKGLDTNKKIDRKRRWSCVFNQEQFEANVTNFILRFMVPFKAVEDPVFRKLFDDLKIKKNDCQLQHLTRDSLMKRVDEILKKSMDEIRKEILVIISQGGSVCTTADVWIGGSRRFLGVTVSWIHPESLERKSAAIACRRFYGTHSFDAIADQLSSIHTSFGLTSQSIQATVTDNGFNFVKAFKEFGVEAMNSFTDSNEEQFQDMDKTIDIGAYETDFDGIDENIEISSEFSSQCENKLPHHFRCASHTLNLIATTDSLKAINNSKPLQKKYFYVIGKCSELWKSLRSPKTSENLKEYLGISLKRPVVTRWNSTFDCLSQLLSVENKLLDNSKTKLSNAFKSEDFKFLAEYIRVSKPLACAIDRLQQTDKSYYGVLLPTLVSLRYEMKKLIDDKTFIDFKPLAQAIIDGINKRFQNLFDPSRPDIDAFLAAISHPLFKGRWLTPFTEEEQKKILERFSEVVSIESTTIKNENEIDEFNFGESSSTIPEFQPSLSQGETAAEVARYLKSRETGLSVLETFPSIRKVFLKFNTPLPSSAPTERLFSHVTMMNLPRYNCLTDDHFEQTVLCKVNAAKTYH